MECAGRVPGNEINLVLFLYAASALLGSAMMTRR
jgi:hypothetical protein